MIDPDSSPRLEVYVEEYFRMRGRRGVMRPVARERLLQRDRFAAMMVHCGDADMMIGGSGSEPMNSVFAWGIAWGVQRS